MQDTWLDFHVLMVQDNIIEYGGILFEEDIFGAYFPIEKRQTLYSCITIRKKGFMGPLSKIWLLEARYLKAFDDQSVKKIGRPSRGVIQRQIIRSSSWKSDYIVRN